MIWPILLIGFGLAQVFLEEYNVSRSTKFYSGIVAVFFGAIPLVIQFAVLLLEFSHLPWKYMPKLILHRLLMSIFGDHGSAACFVAKLSCKLAPQLMANVDYLSRRGTLRKDLASMRHMLLKRAWVVLSASMSTLIWLISFVYAFYLLFFWKPGGRRYIGPLCYFVVLGVFVPICLGIIDLVCYLSLRLVAAAAFGDAFSSKLHTKCNSLMVWLEDAKTVDVFDDCRGKKVIFNWEYPHTSEAAMPNVLRDLDLLRLKLLTRLKEHLSQEDGIGSESRHLDRDNRVEQIRLDLERALQCEEKLSWAGLQAVNWELAFDREASLRWIVLSGKELAEELFRLENLRLGLKRLEAEHSVQSDSREQVEQPLEPHVLDLMIQHLNFYKEEQLVDGEQHESRTHLERERVKMRDWQRSQSAATVSAAQVSISRSRFVLLVKSLCPLSLDTYTSPSISRNLRNYVKENCKSIVAVQIVLGIYFTLLTSPILVFANWPTRRREAPPPSAATYEPQTWGLARIFMVIWGGMLVAFLLICDGLWFFYLVISFSRLAWVIRELKQWDKHVGDLHRKIRWQIAFGWIRERASFRRHEEQATEWYESAVKGSTEMVSWDPKRLISYPQWRTCVWEMRKLQSLIVKEENTKLQDKLTVVKDIRDMRLEVEFCPKSQTQQIEYVIRASCTQESYLSILSTQTFQGYCDTAKASELFKLMNILDDDTFVVKRQVLENNPLLMQVDKIFAIRLEDMVLPCESLEEIVKSILVDGKRLDAIHVSGMSYV